MAVTLAPLEKTAYVTFSQPKSNMDWFRYVDSNPAWAKQLGGEVPVGINTVTFTVRSPVSDLTASCNFTIQVVDKEAPRVTNCPSPFTTFLEPGETSQIVTSSLTMWTLFSSPNPGFGHSILTPFLSMNHPLTSHVSEQEPGELFQSGYHDVMYEAVDAAGNKAKCQFSIHVTGNDTAHISIFRYKSLNRPFCFRSRLRHAQGEHTDQGKTLQSIFRIIACNV